jgi:hypothetical protein
MIIACLLKDLNANAHYYNYGFEACNLGQYKQGQEQKVIKYTDFVQKISPTHMEGF